MLKKMLFLLYFGGFATLGCRDKATSTGPIAPDDIQSLPVEVADPGDSLSEAVVRSGDIADPSAEQSVMTPAARTQAAKSPVRGQELEPTAEVVAGKGAPPDPKRPDLSTSQVGEMPTASVPSPTGTGAKQPPTAEPSKPQPVEPVRTSALPNHDAWDKLLQQYVNAEGRVNYEGFKKDKSRLEAYLKTLETNPPQGNWPKNEQMAFWINAYNAATIKLIIDHYPLASITHLDGGKPWDVKRVKIGSQTYSLNQIENDILRPQFRDARIHFAVNCAALSCPPLLNRAWTAAYLDRYFDQQAKAFINNRRFNKISATSAQVSRIFEWYAADFGTLTTFLNQYAAVKIAAGAKLTYLEYDWGLNKQ